MDLEDENTERKAKLKLEIKTMDSEIDELVYKIYNITASEKKIIEEEKVT